MTERTYSLAGYKLESPLINAAGSISGTSIEHIIREVKELNRSGIGAITLGSFTLPYQGGNEAIYGSPVYHHDKELGLTWNSMNFPNIGMNEAMGLSYELSEIIDNEKPLIYSVTPTHLPEYGDPIDQFRRLIEGVAHSSANLAELDLSCPNSGKPIMGYDLETMHELITALERDVVNSVDLGIKLPPYLTEEHLAVVPDLAKLIKTTKVFKFIVTCNSIPPDVPPNFIPKKLDSNPILSVPSGKGGMSGPSTAKIGRQQLSMWAHELQGSNIDIVSNLGLHNGKELAARVNLGAVAAGGVTFLWESPDRADTVTNMLMDYYEALEANKHF